MAANSKIEPFAVKDCTLAAIATGRHAQNLRERRDRLPVVRPGSIYYRFWGDLLQPHFDDPEYKLWEMGQKTRAFVRENSLLTRQLREHLTLTVGLMHGVEDRSEPG